MEEKPDQKTVNGSSTQSERRRQLFKSFEAKSLHSRSFLTQIADDLTNIFGSTSFLFLNALLFFFWIVLNLGFIETIEPWDPFPFGLLTMVVSLEAIFLSIFVLVAQNRSAVIYFSVFFIVISIIQLFSKKTAFPYTVALLLAGFLVQAVKHFLHLETHFVLDTQAIYYILLPLLLFESAMHINIHQFRLQFLTISFISTFGLLISMFIIGFGLSYVIGFPIGASLLFGALISATDPIAVLSIFKTLGAPKRLALIADGESMFNDATAVIAFKAVAAFVLSSNFFLNSQDIFLNIWTFTYVFLGSILIGALIGFIGSVIISRIKNDSFVEATLTLSFALGSFILSDHFLHLSGVITTVIAALIFGNLGKTRISPVAHKFVNETWEYIAFISVSLVFFFAAAQLNVESLISQIGNLHVVIIIVLIARAVSVYLSFFLSNKLPLFKDEPDIPLSWQHILNWGGLRGVIPLVLAYSLPDTFAYKDEIISFTLATFVFTLLVNALTIRALLTKLKLHLPKKEESIIKWEHLLFEVEQKKKLLKTLPKREFYKNILNESDSELNKLELGYKQNLLSLASIKELEESLRLESLDISRDKIIELFQQGYISEGVVYEYDSQLDLQQDAIEYPEVYYGRGYTGGGRLPNKKLFRDRLRNFNKLIRNLPILSFILRRHSDEIIIERIMMLKAKILCVDEILTYYQRVQKIFSESKEATKVIKKLISEYQDRKKVYEEDFTDLKSQYPSLIEEYQQILIKSVLKI